MRNPERFREVPKTCSVLGVLTAISNVRFALVGQEPKGYSSFTFNRGQKIGGLFCAVRMRAEWAVLRISAVLALELCSALE